MSGLLRLSCLLVLLLLAAAPFSPLLAQASDPDTGAVQAGKPRQDRYPGPPLPDIDTRIYNLDACLRIADQVSPEVMIQRLKIAESHALMGQAQAAGILPEFTGRALVGPAPGQEIRRVPDLAAAPVCLTNPTDPACPTIKVEKSRALDRLGPFFRFELNLVQPLYTWGKLESARMLAQAGIRNSELELALKRAEIRKRIRELYWGLLAAGDGIDLVADVEKQLASNRDTIKEKVEMDDGEFTLTDLYRVEIFLGQLRMQIEKVRAQQELARTTLAVMLGLDPEDEFQLAEEDIAPVEIDLDPVTFYEDSASINHFNARRAGVGVEARRAQLGTLKSWMKPDVFVAGQGFAAYAPRREVRSIFAGDYFRSVGGGVVLGLNFDFSGWMHEAKRDEALAQYEQARIGQEAAIMGLRIQARQAYYEMLRAQRTVEALREANLSSRRWFRSASLNWGVGVETTDNLLIAYQNYLQTRGSFLSAIFENNKAWAELIEAAGLEDTSP